MKNLLKLTWKALDALDRDKTAAIMPIGSVEQHGYHMPLGTDYLLAVKLAEALEAMELTQGEGLILPPIQFGLNTEHYRFPGTICLKEDTITAVLTQQAESLQRHGFHNIVIVNTHGGNVGYLETFIRAYRAAHDCNLTVVDYNKGGFFGEKLGWFDNPVAPDVHAGEFETSMMLYLDPELVDLAQDAKYLCECNKPNRQLPAGWMTHEISKTGMIGDATSASAQKGERYFGYICQRIQAFLEDYLSQC